MAGPKSKIVTGALEGLSDIFEGKNATNLKYNVKEIPEGVSVFETKSWDFLPDDIKNTVFDESSFSDLKDFFAGKINLDDVEYNNESLAKLIFNLSEEGYNKDQIMNLMAVGIAR
tara:strand:+ start:75 stop:419 length:345 start_codon:yes stop_codon:yes gene_type:complete